MKFFNQENGFTLVEVLVAMAILVIIVFSFTLLYTSSFSGIFRAGGVSEELFNAQKDLDNKIAEGSNGSFGEDYKLEMTFNQGGAEPVEVKVEGKILEVPYEYEERSSALKYFLPDDH